MPVIKKLFVIVLLKLDRRSETKMKFKQLIFDNFL